MRARTTLNAGDIIQYDHAGLVVTLNAYKAAEMPKHSELSPSWR